MLLSEPGKVIRCADHLQVLLALPAETIDLILAAPGKQEFFQKGRPSDYLFRRTAVELLRVLKPGGVLVWHVPNERGEATFSTAQFRQVVYFQSIQLRLIDTILVEKERNTPPTPVRYTENTDGELRTIRPCHSAAKGVSPRISRLASFTIST